MRDGTPDGLLMFNFQFSKEEITLITKALCNKLHPEDIFPAYILGLEILKKNENSKLKSLLIDIQQLDKAASGENFHDAVMRLVNSALEK